MQKYLKIEELKGLAKAYKEKLTLQIDTVPEAVNYSHIVGRRGLVGLFVMYIDISLTASRVEGSNPGLSTSFISIF